MTEETEKIETQPDDIIVEVGEEENELEIKKEKKPLSAKKLEAIKKATEARKTKAKQRKEFLEEEKVNQLIKKRMTEKTLEAITEAREKAKEKEKENEPKKKKKKQIIVEESESEEEEVIIVKKPKKKVEEETPKKVEVKTVQPIVNKITWDSIRWG